ncbi:acyltransferase [Chryseobacterium fluminis]|uniref:acyltransferase family protein n=1 Tax=Chryseobacterium fluminis TaxID=2983606 RepID=UPI00224D621C|nr:acyltransferase [Chryseobacterium sp. MMS21-Ot14]UZT97136.1 acyltransferase [Chryseobacterium sp. MMS21-Ot14]
MMINQITFTRFLAAISIVIFHFGHNTFFYENDYINFIISHANIGVSYFFILSGFIMVIAYNNKSINAFDYYKNRFARIYPMYIFALLLFLTISDNNSKTLILYHILGIQSWIPGFPLTLNMPGWSISVEIFFYSLFPLIFYFLKKYTFKTVSIAIITFWIISQLFTHFFLMYFYEGYPSKSHDFVFYFPVIHLNEFLIGNLSALFFLTKIKVKNYDILIIIFVLITIIIFKFTSLQLHNGLLAVTFAPLIILISANNGYITKIFNNKILHYLGEVSYSLYILQYPVHVIMEKACIHYHIPTNNLQFFSIFVLVLLIFSAISYELIEKNARRLIKKFS